jgi:hypothetical protein
MPDKNSFYLRKKIRQLRIIRSVLDHRQQRIVAKPKPRIRRTQLTRRMNQIVQPSDDLGAFVGMFEVQADFPFQVRRESVSDSYEREVRDLPCFEFLTMVVVELYRVRCPNCGVKTEKVPQLPSKAPFSKRFEEAVGLACESAACGATVWAAQQHGASHRSALSAALGGGTKEAGVAADGSG